MPLHRKMNILVSSLAQTHATWQIELVISRSMAAVQGLSLSLTSLVIHVLIYICPLRRWLVPLLLLQPHSKEDADCGLPMTYISDGMVEFLELHLGLVLSRWTSWRTHNIQCGRAGLQMILQNHLTVFPSLQGQ